MLCVLNVGTVPTLCFLNVGTVPTFSHSLIFLLMLYNVDIIAYTCEHWQYRVQTKRANQKICLMSTLQTGKQDYILNREAHVRLY